jgi:hypothetical protein
MDQNDILLGPHHLGVPSGASKTISEPLVRLVQTVHLSRNDTNTVSKWTKTRFHLTHASLEFHQVNPKWFSSLSYIRRQPHLSCVKSNTISIWTKTTFHITTSPSICIMCVQDDFFEPVVRLKQTVHLSCIDTNTVSTWTKTRFHMNQVT